MKYKVQKSKIKISEAAPSAATINLHFDFYILIY